MELKMIESLTYDFVHLFDNMQNGIYFVDKDRKITYWNKSAERISGFSAEEVIGSSCSDDILIHVDEQGKNLCQHACPFADAIKKGVDCEKEMYIHHKKGHRIPVKVHTIPLKDQKGAIVGAAELFNDISFKSLMSLRIKELERLSLIDNLTKLANRRYLDSELEMRFEEKKRYGLRFGIIFMDIDGFKHYNDAYGHTFGDLVLTTISSTFRSLSRPFDLFGRWGGEEFMGIIRDVNKEDLVKIGERIRILVERTRIATKTRDINVTISVGATVVGSHDNKESIFHRADTLMYKSKKNGGNCLTTDEPQQTQPVNSRQQPADHSV
jgi:diguanylate cyclase (GGDEF)-like protein/PAS domain S-box-containing protein